LQQIRIGQRFYSIFCDAIAIFFMSRLVCLISFKEVKYLTYSLYEECSIYSSVTCDVLGHRQRWQSDFDGMPVSRRTSLRLQQQQRRILPQPGLVRSTLLAAITTCLSLQTMFRCRLHVRPRSAHSSQWSRNLSEIKQEIWAIPHETRDSIGFLVAWSVSITFGEKNLRRSLNRKKNPLKPTIFRFQGRSKSSMLVPPESSSAVLVTISSKSVSFSNRTHPRLGNIGNITIS